MDKANFAKWKEHTVYIFFINISWPKIEKDDITAIKVIASALKKPNLSYITFANSIWTLIICSEFYFIFDNISSAKDERLSLL